MPTPPLAITGTEVAASTAPSWSRSGPSRVPSRPISVTTSAATPDAVEPLRRGRRGRRPSPRPSPGRPPRVPRASSPTATWPGMQHAELARPASGRSTAAVPTTTRSTPGEQQLAGRLDAAHAPARLHPARDRGARSPRSRRGCVALTGAGGVEVDDVDPLRARGLELAGDAHGVVVVDGLGVEVALVQADARCRRAGRSPGSSCERRALRGVPLVDGTPVPSILTASRSAAPRP